MSGITTLSFSVLIKKKENEWTAHCLELDIVASAKNFNKVRREIASLVAIQLDYAFSNDNLDHLYRPAPMDIWKEFYDCSRKEKRIKVNKSLFERASSVLPHFAPPELISRTCSAVA